MMTKQKQNQQNTSVFEIAIVGRVMWNLHSLNNEGTIGNVTEPRTVVLWNGTKTDGISGEMLKHIHAFWTWLQAKQNNYPLCQACQSFKPQRADADRSELNGNNADAMKRAINRCVMCDLNGFLVQQPTINRQSTVEFGWMVGIPDRTYRDLHVHARHAAGERRTQEQVTSETEDQGRNEQSQGQEERQVPAQMVYHRPTRSGVYAFVTLFQPWRIGLNEVDYTYGLDDDDKKEGDKEVTGRKTRYQLALSAYEWLFKRPDGAMTTTRFPHIEKIEGLVLVSRRVIPVPLLSPLRDDYRDRLKTLAASQGVEAHEFADLPELTNVLTTLREATPIRLFERGSDHGSET